MSTSLLPGLLNKRHLEKDEETKEAAGSSEAVGGAMSLESPPATSYSDANLPFPTKEQCASMAQLLQYVHSLVVSSCALFGLSCHLAVTVS